jgi:hypothetical protein
MLSIHSFTPGEALDLRVELPHEIRRIVSIKLRAVVKWCQGDVNPDFMDIGLDLIDTPEDLAIVLADIQRLYCFDE